MINKEVARIFYEISKILELKNVQWKPQAYNKAARVIEDLDKDVKEIYEEKGMKGLDEIPNVGSGIAKKIEEYIKTGKIKEYDKLKKSIPKGLMGMMEVGGIGPKRAKFLYQKLGIRNVNELEKAAKMHKIKELERFGEKSEKDIEESIEIFKKRKNDRLLLGEVLPIAEAIIRELNAKKAIACGSLRRMYETIGDIDILAAGENPKEIIEKFCNLNEVKKILAKGETKGMVLLKNNLQADIRVVKEQNFGSALQYFTGSKDHGIEIRKIAIKKGMKLSEYGLFRKDKCIAGKNEEEIYNKLGMEYIEPELRENKGEIEIALKHKLPKIVKYDEIKGDLHVHTNHSDGSDNILKMVETAKKLGHEYIGISDHSKTRKTKTRKISGGLSENELLKEIKEARKINVKGIKVLIGSEVDILGDGSLDYSDKILKELDYVTAGIHSGFKGDATKRILKAMENKYMNILAHPTGRLINKRGGYKIDFKKILDKAKENNIILEINAHPERLDLRDEMIKDAINNGNKLIIGTDAHNSNGLNNMKLGIGQARKGWARKEDILNTLSWKELNKILKRKNG